MPVIFDVTGSYKHTWTTGAVTTIAAGTATAGHILALRNATSAARTIRLRSLEVEFILTTAFGAAQEVGFDAYVARVYTAAHTGATALTMTGGRKVTTYDNPTLTGRIADAGALTAGTHTLDANAFARGSAWFSAVGQTLAPRFYDFSATEPGGIFLAADTGIVIRNTVLMGATGVGKWHFTAEFDEGILG